VVQVEVRSRMGKDANLNRILIFRLYNNCLSKWIPKAVFGWLVVGWLAGQPPHEITIHILPEQYFSLTTIRQNSIFQSCPTGPKSRKIWPPVCCTNLPHLSAIRIFLTRNMCNNSYTINQYRCAKHFLLKCVNISKVTTYINYMSWLLV